MEKYLHFGIKKHPDYDKHLDFGRKTLGFWKKNTWILKKNHLDIVRKTPRFLFLKNAQILVGKYIDFMKKHLDFGRKTPRF